MTQQAEGLQRIAGAALIVGAVVLIVGNGLAPRVDEPGDPGAVIENVVDNATQGKAVFLAIVVGLWLLVLGFAGVYRSIATGTGATLARVSFYAFVAGTAAFTVVAGLFGPGLAVVAEQWAELDASADKDAMFQAFSALYWATTGIFSATVIAYWGALLVLSIGIAVSGAYPVWLGWVGAVTSAAVIVVGAIYPFVDLTQGLELTFAGVAFLSTLWALALGIVLARRA